MRIKYLVQARPWRVSGQLPFLSRSFTPRIILWSFLHQSLILSNRMVDPPPCSRFLYLPIHLSQIIFPHRHYHHYRPFILLFIPPSPFAFTLHNPIFHGFRIVFDSAPLVTYTPTATIRLLYFQKSISILHRKFYTLLNSCTNIIINAYTLLFYKRDHNYLPKRLTYVTLALPKRFQLCQNINKNGNQQG